MLHERDARTLARVRKRQRPLLIAGTLLFLLGAVYSLWAVDRLHGTPAAEETARAPAAHDAGGALAARGAPRASRLHRPLAALRPAVPGRLGRSHGGLDASRHDAGPAPAAEHFSPLADLTRVRDSCRTGRDTGEHAHPSRRDAARAVAR